jgi:lycopene cyclase domain-containing protein
MTAQNFSYCLFETAGITASLLIIYSLGAIRTLATRRFLAVVVAQYSVWITWDYLAVELGVFYYPHEGNLPLRVLGLPLEEHLFFPFHSLLSWAVVLLVQAAKPPAR